MHFLKRIIFLAMLFTVSAASASGTITPGVSFPVTVSQGGNGSAQTGNAGLSNMRGATQLPHWNKALARVLAGKGNARVLFIGDSITAGYYSTNVAFPSEYQSLSFPTLFSNLLNARGILANSNTVTGGGDSDRGVTASSLITLGSGWSYLSLAFPGMGGAIFLGSSGSGALAYTPNVSVDTFKFRYNTGTGIGLGTLNYNIDGAANTGINTNVATSFPERTVTTTLGTHTLNLSAASGNALVETMEAYDSTKSQVMIYNAGWSGSKTGDWINSVAVYSPAPACSAIAPDLVVINLQVNDEVNAVAVATFKANFQTLITACQVGGNTDVVLMTGIHSNPADTISEAAQGTYAAAIRQLALTNANSTIVSGLPVIDEFTNLVSYNYQNTYLGAVYLPGTFPQDLHLTYNGYGIMARDIATVLLGY